MDVNREGEIEDRNIPILHPINLYVGVSTRLAEWSIEYEIQMKRQKTTKEKHTCYIQYILMCHKIT